MALPFAATNPIPFFDIIVSLMAKAFAMRETMMSTKGIGFVAANGSAIKNYGEKRVVGYTEDGEGVSIKITREDGDKVLRSVHRFNAGGML